MENKIKKTILIIEDERSLSHVLKERLDNEKFGVFEVNNGEDGIKIALEEHPDLILLDILMPGIDGIGVLKNLSEDDWGKNAKVIILTNASDNEKITQAIEYGSYDYLIKADWKLEDIVLKVKEKLGVE